MSKVRFSDKVVHHNRRNKKRGDNHYNPNKGCGNFLVTMAEAPNCTLTLNGYSRKGALTQAQIIMKEGFLLKQVG